MNSLEFVTLWRSRDTHRSKITPILGDIQDLVTAYMSFSVIHIRRPGNTATLLCVRNASSSNVVIWENTRPGFLLWQLQEDCNHPD
jgi:hypothetical protein